jgi:hypothetical protein
MSRSEYVSTLPPWRRLLAMLNWRPVYDIEQQELASKKRLQQLKNETEQIKNEAEQLRQENKRLAALNSRMDALLLNADSSSQTPPATGSRAKHSPC